MFSTNYLTSDCKCRLLRYAKCYMSKDLDEFSKILNSLSISLDSAIKQTLLAHKLATTALATLQNHLLNPSSDRPNIEDSKKEILKLLRLSIEQLNRGTIRDPNFED